MAITFDPEIKLGHMSTQNNQLNELYTVPMLSPLDAMKTLKFHHLGIKMAIFN